MSADVLNENQKELIRTINSIYEQGGGRWIARSVVEHMKRLVLTRSKQVNDLTDRALRLAVVLNACSRRGYVDQMHVRMRRIDAASVRQAILEAQGGGRLIGLCEADQDEIRFDGRSQLAFFGKPYTISYGQAPLAIAYLELMHNAFGYQFSEIERLVRQIGDSRAIDSTDKATLALRRMMDDWLKDKLKGEYQIRQEAAFRGHLRAVAAGQAKFEAEDRLSGSGEKVSITIDGVTAPPVDVENWHRIRWPLGYRQFRESRRPTLATEPYAGGFIDLIEDETILLFWESLSNRPQDAEQIGVRRFRSAARCFLDYRQSLIAMAAEMAEGEARSLQRDDGGVIDIRDARGAASRENPLTDDRVTTVIAREPEDDWVSPLAALTETVDAPVKWLTAADIDLLGRVMKSRDDGPALFGKYKPDSRYARTIARAMVFGDIQELAIARKQWRAEMNRNSSAYMALRDEFNALEEKIRNLAYASIHALIERGEKFKAVVLLMELEPGVAQELEKIQSALKNGSPHRGVVAAEAGKTINDLIAPETPLGKRLKAGFRATNRAGFRPADISDPLVKTELVDHARHVFPLLDQVSDFASGFEWLALHDAYSNDARRFDGALTTIYGQGA